MDAAGRSQGGVPVSHRGHRAYIGPVPSPTEGDPELWRADTEAADGRMVERVDGPLDDRVTWARKRSGWVPVLPADSEPDVMRCAGTDPRPDDVPQFWDKTSSRAPSQPTSTLAAGCCFGVTPLLA